MTTAEAVPQPDGLPTVWQAFAAAKAAVSPVGKDSVNNQQHFKFRGVDAVVNAAAPELNKQGIVIVPKLKKVKYSTEEVGQKRTVMANVRVKVRYRFAGPAGDFFDVIVPGEAMDSGDKGVAKAMTVAYRIALTQALNLPTGDPEVDENSYERSPRQEHRSAGAAFDNAAPAPPRQRQQEQPRPPVQGPVLDPEDPWKARIDDIADRDEAAMVYAEVADLLKDAKIDQARATLLGAAITARVANLGLAAEQEQQAPAPARIRPEDQGARQPAAPPASPDAGERESQFTTDFTTRLAVLSDISQVLPMQRELGHAIRNRVIGPEVLANLQADCTRRGRELELAANGAAV